MPTRLRGTGGRRQRGGEHDREGTRESEKAAHGSGLERQRRAVVVRQAPAAARLSVFTKSSSWRVVQHSKTSQWRW